MSEFDPTARELGLKMLQAIRSLQTVLADRFPAAFAGIYNGGDNHKFVVLTVGDDRDLREFVAAYLREATTEDASIFAQLPAVSFRPAAQTRRSLLDLRSRIMAERDELRANGIVIYSAGPRDDHNCVVIKAAPMSDDQRQELARRHGNVEVWHTTPPRRT
jgi:hypothetical protein